MKKKKEIKEEKPYIQTVNCFRQVSVIKLLRILSLPPPPLSLPPLLPISFPKFHGLFTVGSNSIVDSWNSFVVANNDTSNDRQASTITLRVFKNFSVIVCLNMRLFIYLFFLCVFIPLKACTKSLKISLPPPLSSIPPTIKLQLLFVWKYFNEKVACWQYLLNNSCLWLEQKRIRETMGVPK